jgi:hypothetical protein
MAKGLLIAAMEFSDVAEDESTTDTTPSTFPRQPLQGEVAR